MEAFGDASSVEKISPCPQSWNEPLKLAVKVITLVVCGSVVLMAEMREVLGIEDREILSTLPRCRVPDPRMSRMI